MSEQPPTTRITDKDVPGSPEWIRPLYKILNRNFDWQRRAADRGFTIQANLATDVRDVVVDTLSTYSSGEFTVLKYETKLARGVLGVIALQVTKTATPEAVLSGSHQVRWSSDGPNYKVLWIDGLVPSMRYDVRLLALGR